MFYAGTFGTSPGTFYPPKGRNGRQERVSRAAPGGRFDRGLV